MICLVHVNKTSADNFFNFFSKFSQKIINNRRRKVIGVIFKGRKVLGVTEGKHFMVKTFHNCLISSMATSVSKNRTNSRPHAVDVTSYDARGYILPFCYKGISKVLNIPKMSSVHPSSQYIPYVLNWIQVWAICWPWQDVDVVKSI